MERKSSRAFLVVSLIVAFPLLLLAFAQIFANFVVRPLFLLLPDQPSTAWPEQIAVWTLAAAASLAVCRLLARRQR